MSEFHFMRPGWLLCLPLLVLIFWWLWRRQFKSRSWQSVCDPQLLPHLLLGRSQRRANWPLWLVLIAGLLIITALAGPAWQRKSQPLFRQQSALVILLDLSRSMLATDLKPSRYVRAQLKISDLLRKRQEGQTALIVFAGDAFILTPLTTDQRTIEALLKSLSPDLMPVQGSKPQRALKLGRQLLQQAGLSRGRLLLVTDEDRTTDLTDAVTELRQQGFELAIIGVGSREGAPIPLAEGGFYKDRDGNLVLPRLNEKGLRQLARHGGGEYRRLSIDDTDLQAVLSGLDQQGLDQSLATDARGETWQEEGVWLLWPLTLLAACAFRRGWLMMLMLLLSLPPNAQAFTWQDLWQRPDQRATKTFAEGAYTEAAQQFEDPAWQAAAHYQAGDYGAAATAMTEPLTADNWYNKGNALAKSGDLNGAITAYNEALNLKPDHQDALINKELVEKELKQQQQQQQQQQSAKNQQAAEQPEKSQQAPKSSPGQKQAGEDDNPATATTTPQEMKNSTADETEPAKPSAPPPAETPPGQKNREAQDTTQHSTSTATEVEAQRLNQQIFQQIPDDPGGLLRRKFRYQYRKRGQQQETDRPW